MDGLYERYPVLDACRTAIDRAIRLLTDSFTQGGKLLLCGNGGSCADCEHIVGELMKGFLLRRPLSSRQKAEMKRHSPGLTDAVLDELQCAVPAIALPQAAALGTAFANDVAPQLVFAQSVMGLGRSGDVLLCLSTSGNAENCLAAARVAKGLGLAVIGLTGASGGRLREVADVCIRAPERETYKVQELHLPIYHEICRQIEQHFFGAAG